MSSHDRITNSYYLDTLGGDVFVTANDGFGNITLRGNVAIIGKLTDVKSIETQVNDNIITLNAATTGNPILDAGIDVRRGTSPTVGVHYNEVIDRWQLTNDGYIWRSIMTRLQDDLDPHLGGNLYVNGFDIRSESPQNIQFRPGWNGLAATTGIEITNITGSLTSVANATVIASKEPNAGQTGLYVSNSIVTDRELITKRKALVYALIL